MSEPVNDLPVISYMQPDDPPLKRFLIDWTERISGRARIEAIHRQLHAEQLPFPDFFSRGLELAGVHVTANQNQERRIPREGPVVFIANHPFGVVDGAIMCELASRTRGDFKILLHARLCRDPKLEPLFLPVSFEENRDAIKINVETKRTAQRVLAEGGTVVIFPSGGVATRGRFGLGKLEDLPWSTFVGKIVAQSKATVVPVYFHGENRFLFHFVSAFSQTLRTALFLSEVVNKLGTSIRVSVGQPIKWSEMASIPNRKALTVYLKEQTFSLADAENDAPATNPQASTHA